MQCFHNYILLDEDVLISTMSNCKQGTPNNTFEPEPQDQPTNIMTKEENKCHLNGSEKTVGERK